MKALIAWARGFVIAFGGPGLFVVAFLDSSFLSLPEINDILIVWVVMQHKDRFAYYVAMATLGSLVGCTVLYWLAWKGGEAFLRKRMSAGRIERGRQAVARHGLFALLVPALLPPPAPFKVFVLLAGVARVKPRSFALAIIVGRGLRYIAEGLLAVWYGELAITYVKQHGAQAALATAAVVVAGGAALIYWRSRRARASA